VGALTNFGGAELLGSNSYIQRKMLHPLQLAVKTYCEINYLWGKTAESPIRTHGYAHSPDSASLPLN
jgi:hypothetical protein